jgi:hypothetical protein
MLQLGSDPSTIKNLIERLHNAFQACQVINGNPKIDLTVLKTLRNKYATGIWAAHTLRTHSRLRKILTFGDLIKNILLNS